MQWSRENNCFVYGFTGAAELNMTNLEYSKELGKKITKGMKLAHKRLVLERAKNDDTLIIYENGKIVKKKAKDMLKKKGKK